MLVYFFVITYCIYLTTVFDVFEHTRHFSLSFWAFDDSSFFRGRPKAEVYYIVRFWKENFGKVVPSYKYKEHNEL